MGGEERATADSLRQLLYHRASNSCTIIGGRATPCKGKKHPMYSIYSAQLDIKNPHFFSGKENGNFTVVHEQCSNETQEAPTPGSPLKSYLQISFPVQLEIFPVPISEIWKNFICETNFEKFAANIAIFCIFRIREFTKQNSLCFDKFSKFPVFPDRKCL